MDKILLDHGSGGLFSNELIHELFLPVFGNKTLNHLDDGAVLNIKNKRISFSTDTFVVDPIFFPGGSIGDLAINGTVNDISMCGGIPKFLSISFILEEGFSIENLKKIILDIGKAANKAKIKIVTGDTKVVPKGKVDKIFINTSGIGEIPNNISVSSKSAKIGDNIIISGTIADHGVAILSKRDGLNFKTNIKSDTFPLNSVIEKIIKSVSSIHVLRDPTRGGIGTSLNEIAKKSNVGIKIFEQNIPIKKETSKICELLGFDPIYIANEGKFIIFVSKSDSKKVLSIIKNEEIGKNASIIGEVTKNHPGQVLMKTTIGGIRVIGMLIGEQLPRIC